MKKNHSKLKAAIIGMGFVGLSLAVVLASKKVTVYGIEKDKTKLNSLKQGKSHFYEPKLRNWLKKTLKTGKLRFSESIREVFDDVDLIFVTVGTPTKNGKINLNFIKSVSQSIGKLLKSNNNPLIVIKSTIVPGTTDKVILPILEKHSKKKAGKAFFVATNPEFLREGRAIQDQLYPHLVVIGSNEPKAQKILKKFYEKIYSSKIPRVYVNFATSEIIKYANNAFLATKISFINSISNLCQKIPNTNIDIIAKCIGMDPRIGPEFLKAGPGYGGSCLPKDLDSLISTYKSYGANPVLLRSVKEVNTRQIEEILKIMKQKLKNLNNKKISILGLAFKENSDDIRYSISIKLIQKLLQNGSKVNVHDPQAIPNTKKIFNTKINYFDSIQDCFQNSDCAVIMTGWPQYSKLTQQDFAHMKKSLVIDTRRILSNTKLDIDYNAIGVTS